MSHDPQDEKFRKWLDILQQESWQLELIISGFAIYGLFMVIDPIEMAILESQTEGNFYRTVLFQGLKISWYIITVNLLAHVILRGLWIGAIGLRYVSGDIDYDTLNYSSRFRKHLMKRVGSFDRYVATLELYCSVIFAVTFILVFYLIGLLVITFAMTLLGLWIAKDETPNWIRFAIAVPAVVFLSIGMILTFFDFVTQGWLKKKKWTSKLYYPFYWVFKYLSLSVLYRPMVYNLLDTRFGKRLSMIMVPLYLGITILAGTGFSTSNYLEDEMPSNTFTTSRSHYEDEMQEDILFADRATIPSRSVTDTFLKVFIVYGKSIEDDVFYFNKDLKPEEDKRGIYSVFSDGTVDGNNSRLRREYLETLEEMYLLKVDSLEFKPQFLFTENSKKQLGFETGLDLLNIPRGKHLLQVTRKDHRQDSVYYRRIVSIPFWYFPGNK